nr:Fru [Callinectes sapidus]
MTNSDEEMIALRWNNHLTTLSQLLFSLREEESLIDATLACDGKLFPAHKFVLSMCSEYFKEMFTTNPCKHPIVYMKDVKSEDMEALLDFMYRGVVHIPQESLTGLLKTAEGLQIRGLGMFAREAALSENGGIPTSDRSVVSGALEPNVMVSPERKRPYDMDHSETSLVNFSDGELDDQPLHTSTTSTTTTTTTPKKPKISSIISDDCTNDVPAPIPDLPRVSEDMLDLGGGVTIPASDYFKFRRTNANRYINDLLRYFFPVEVLASSSLTGGECFANKDKGPSNKNQLDPCIIRVITHDAIRNFPAIDEKQVRNAIRRKLNTESRIYRSQEKFGGILPKRNPVQRRRSRFAESPRALVSIEKSADREKDKGPPMVTPNVTVEKAPSKDSRRATYVSGQQQDKDGKRDGDTSYFSRLDKAVRPGDQGQPSNSATPTPVATPSLPSSSSSPATGADKTFKLCHENLVKAELPAASQYLPQEYSYPTVMPPHVSQAYLPHHMAAADPTYLRRLEMSQATPHPAALSYTYPHATLPTSESMEPSLHM